MLLWLCVDMIAVENISLQIVGKLIQAQLHCKASVKYPAYNTHAFIFEFQAQILTRTLCSFTLLKIVRLNAQTVQVPVGVTLHVIRCPVLRTAPGSCTSERTTSASGHPLTTYHAPTLLLIAL